MGGACGSMGGACSSIGGFCSGMGRAFGGLGWASGTGGSRACSSEGRKHGFDGEACDSTCQI